MNNTRQLLLSMCVLFLLASCSDTTGGQSAPVDSTNQKGIAPAQYTEGTPDNRVDTTIHQRDAMMKDTLTGQGRTLPQNQPVGNGTNTSNTTDQRTTSGSANNGDADKDRKK